MLNLLIVEGEERPLRRWDFVHCPPETKHMIVGAGDAAPCVVLAVGARTSQSEPWGGYTPDPVAARHGVSVERETDSFEEATAHLQRRRPARYRECWLG